MQVEHLGDQWRNAPLKSATQKAPLPSSAIAEPSSFGPWASAWPSSFGVSISEPAPGMGRSPLRRKRAFLLSPQPKEDKKTGSSAAWLKSPDASFRPLNRSEEYAFSRLFFHRQRRDGNLDGVGLCVAIPPASPPHGFAKRAKTKSGVWSVVPQRGNMRAVLRTVLRLSIGSQSGYSLDFVVRNTLQIFSGRAL